jgi:hypothetical protein
MKRVIESLNEEAILYPIIIQKELIQLLHFPKQEVLFTSEEKENRNKQLLNLNITSQLQNQIIQILFEDIEGPKLVETNNFIMKDECVCIDKTVIIPSHRIVKIINY